MPVLWISRDAGAPAERIAKRLAERLELTLIDHGALIDWLAQVYALEHPGDDKGRAALERQLAESPKAWCQPLFGEFSAKDYLSFVLPARAKEEALLLLGMGAGGFFAADDPSILKVHLTEDFDRAAKRLAKSEKREATEVMDELLRTERRYRRFRNTLFNAEEQEYQISLACDTLSTDAIIAVIEALWKNALIEEELRESSARQGAKLHLQDEIELKNDSESDFAHLLDLYHIDYRYEPKTFPIEWDEGGKVSLAFSPDFYLPAFDLYLELTTMDQAYVRMKKKKLHKLAELYPGVNCRIVYKRDFLSLLEHLED